MIVSLVMCSAGAFGATWLLRYSDGPWDLFFRLRKLAGLYLPEYSPTGEVTAWIENDEPFGFWAKLVGCFWCLTTWVSLFFALGYILLANLEWWLLFHLWLGTVGISIFAHEVITDE